MVSTQTGKDIKTEADRARQSVPPEFLAGARTPLSDTFETKVAALSGERGRGNDATADIAFVDAEPTGHKTEQDRRNTASRILSNKDNAERLASGAGALSGTIRDDMNGKVSDRVKRQAEEKRRKDRADTAMYLALLQAQIADLDKEIGDLEDARNYLARTGDVAGTIAKPSVRNAIEAWQDKTGQKFDPNDPSAKDNLAKILDEQQKEAQSKRDKLANEQDRIAKNAGKNFAVADDGKSLKDPAFETLAQKVDEYRKAHDIPPVDRTDLSKQDIQDMLSQAQLEASYARSEQRKIGEKQQALSKETPDNQAFQKFESAQENVEEALDTAEATSEKLMKELGRIKQIADPAERLQAEKRFVEAVRALPEELSDVMFEIEESEDTAHMFEDGYFDNLKGEPEIKHASANQAPPPVGPTSSS